MKLELLGSAGGRRVPLAPDEPNAIDALTRRDLACVAETLDRTVEFATTGCCSTGE